MHVCSLPEHKTLHYTLGGAMAKMCMHSVKAKIKFWSETKQSNTAVGSCLEVSVSKPQVSVGGHQTGREGLYVPRQRWPQWLNQSIYTNTHTGWLTTEQKKQCRIWQQLGLTKNSPYIHAGCRHSEIIEILL